MATTTQRSVLRPLISLLAAVLLGLSLSACSGATPEDTAKRDELYKSEFVQRGFTNPVKLSENWGALGTYSDWAVGLGICRIEFRIHDTSLEDWDTVQDAATLLDAEMYAQCR